jgi:hypothetical protein
MHRIIVSLAIALFVAIAAHTSVSAQITYSRPRPQDTGHISLVFDGKQRIASAVAYVIEGRLYIGGTWLHDSTARYGTDAVASAYLLRVDNSVGDHPIDPQSVGETLFSMVYSGHIDDKAYGVFRSDQQGGNGTITILSITDESVRGAFSFTAYNKENPKELRTITGQFDVPYRLIMR